MNNKFKFIFETDSKHIDEILNLIYEYYIEIDKFTKANNSLIYPIVQKSKTWKKHKINELNSILNSKESKILKIVNNNQIIGIAILEIKYNDNIYNIRKIGKIRNMYIKEEFRGQNLSTKIFELSKEYFKSNNCKYISMNVHNANNKAYNIYKNWGFVERHTEMYKDI